MFKIIKKVLLGSVSILIISVMTWTIILLNPSWSYAHETQIDFVTIHHNSELGEEATVVVKEAIDLIKRSPIYTKETKIDLCLNDDDFYKNIHPLYGKCLGYAVMDKTIIKNCSLDFKENLAHTKWEENNFEARKFKLSYLFAHEFTHNLQFLDSPGFFFKSPWAINWKLEGHADYTARGFQNDGLLKNKIDIYEEEKTKQHNGYPVLKLKDGTSQILSYYKYALVIQYLMEVKKLNFKQILESDLLLDNVYDEMIEWRNNE